MMTQTILYSFRRCPYAIRARLALRISGTPVYLREILLRDKPPALLQCSAKGTVPVLQLGSGRVLDESLDIMQWALSLHDPEDWLLARGTATQRQAMHGLIARNDSEFKPLLDCYKYADRYPHCTSGEHRERATAFVVALEQCLQAQQYLVAATPTLADMAILPFIRQFATVDRQWFDAAPWPALQAWLQRLLSTELFHLVMVKHPVWREGAEPMVMA